MRRGGKKEDKPIKIHKVIKKRINTIVSLLLLLTLGDNHWDMEDGVVME